MPQPWWLGRMTRNTIQQVVTTPKSSFGVIKPLGSTLPIPYLQAMFQIANITSPSLPTSQEIWKVRRPKAICDKLDEIFTPLMTEVFVRSSMNFSAMVSNPSRKPALKVILPETSNLEVTFSIMAI